MTRLWGGGVTDLLTIRALLGGSLLPQAASVGLGDSLHRFGSAFLTALDVSGHANIGGSLSTATLDVIGSSTFGNTLALAPIPMPASPADQLYNVGGDLYWAGNVIGGASTGAWATDGTNVWRSGGNVGIGTASPSSLFSVGSSSQFQINSTGAITTATGITSSGAITFSGLNTAGLVTNTAGGVLGTTALSADTFTQYALLAGRSGGQTLIGGTGSGETLTLQSTANATKGKILFGTSGYDEANNRLGIGTASPTTPLYVAGIATAQSATSTASLGAEILGDQTGATASANGVMVTKSISVTNGQTYYITWTQTGSVGNNGSVRPALGSVNGGYYAYYNTAAQNFSVVLVANTTGTVNLTFTVSGYVSGTIIIADTISLKAITKSTLSFSAVNSDGSSALDIRSGGIGLKNTFIGLNVGGNNTIGVNNTASGYNSLFSNTTGNNNTASGLDSLYSNTTGVNNTASGYYADLYTPTNGFTLTITSATANLGIGIYRYKVSYVLTIGGSSKETALSDEKSVTTTSGNQEVTIASIPTYSGPYTCTARKIYRTVLGGAKRWYLDTTIADNTTTGFIDTVADGSLGAEDAGPNNSIMLGYQTKAYKSSQFIVGSESSPITEMWLGKGALGTAADNVILGASGVTGTNIAGSNLTFSGGFGTGTGLGGSLIFQTAGAGTTGSSANAFLERMRIDGSGNLGIGTASPTGRLQASVPNAAVTTTTYDGYFENLATNTTTDAINKYGLYVTSTGAYTGSGGTATNNYGLYLNTTAGADNNYDIYAASGAYLTTGGTWTNAPSYRRYKEHFTPTTGYLDKLMTLDVYEWQYRNATLDGVNRFTDDPYRHASPFLDDFYATFGLGTEHGYNIQDLAGVAIASVKELNQRFIDQNTVNASTFDAITLKTDANATTLGGLQGSVDAQLLTVSGSLVELGKNAADLAKRVTKTEGRLDTLETTVQTAATADAARDQKIVLLSSDVDTLKTGLASLMDFYTTLNLGNVLVLDANGNLSLPKASLSVLGLTADTVTAKDVNASNDVTAKGIVAGAVIEAGKDSSGAATLVAGDGKIVIGTAYAGKDVKIFVTPRGSPHGKALYVDDIVEGKSFSVYVDGAPSAQDIDFSWFVLR